MRYGELPKDLGLEKVNPTEMFFYQYLPIKLSGQTEPVIEKRLMCLSELIGNINCQFVAEYGLENFVKHNTYVTAKHQFQTPGCSFNRKGYHSDGFLTDDINYVWSNKQPTVFNSGKFELTLDDSISLSEMQEQAEKENEVTYPNGTLLRLNQYNIHKVGECKEVGLRLFVKVSFSLDKYDLLGNSKNYLLDYDWDMQQRKNKRNIPQSNILISS